MDRATSPSFSGSESHRSRRPQNASLPERAHERFVLVTELGHTVAQYARDLHAFPDQHELDDVVLIGWSMGALVSWDYVDQFGTGRLRGLVDVDMEATRFQWDDYDYGITDLEGLKATLELVQQDQTSLIERGTEQVFKDPPSAEMRTMQFDELSRTPAPIKSAILFDALTHDYRCFPKSTFRCWCVPARTRNEEPSRLFVTSRNSFQIVVLNSSKTVGTVHSSNSPSDSIG
ncbi:alpha/beta fold hydrolase [Natronorubrum halalkaliphilum]|uniref:alpha/beta fold hydrolase n=1 Tax=Natronorubrum halalkaliphilum TaxID=2691917 RepID=UPI001F32B3C4|nr:alpha/beta hydrolase [Natronorubrum halalkaliphilum]